MLNSYYRVFCSGQLPTIYSFDSSILRSYRIDYLQIANFYGFYTHKLYMDSLDPGLDVVMRVKHKAYNFRAESNLYSLSRILSFMTPSIGMRDSFTGNRFLSSLSSLLYGTHFHAFSPLKSDYVNRVFPGSVNSHKYLAYHLLSNIVMVNPDSWVTTTPPKGSGCVPCLGSSASSPSLVLPFSKKAALSSHYFCKNFVFICSCCRS